MAGSITSWWNTTAGTDVSLRQKHFDWLKRSYARKHGLEPLVIPYTEYSEIEEKLSAVLKED